MTNSELIQNHTIFFAYFCHLIDLKQAEAVEELCEIGWKLDEEINRRKIGQLEIEDCIKSATLDPQDQIMIDKYIFPNDDSIN